MRYAYIVRFPNDSGPMHKLYGIRDLPQGPKRPRTIKSLLTQVTKADLTPPTLRRKTGGHFDWDYINEPMSPREFHRLYPHIHLEPGEGPILVDLHDVSTKRSSRAPEN